MKAIVCEMCGSQDLVKQDGYYVCQNCGTKYSTEEAKKLMVEVSGNVTVQGVATADGIIENALNTYNQGNYEEAYGLFTNALNLQPGHPRATFYRGMCAACLGTIEKQRLSEGIKAANQALLKAKSEWDDASLQTLLIEIALQLPIVTRNINQQFNDYTKKLNSLNPGEYSASDQELLRTYKNNAIYSRIDIMSAAADLVDTLEKVITDDSDYPDVTCLSVLSLIIAATELITFMGSNSFELNSKAVKQRLMIIDRLKIDESKPDSFKLANETAQKYLKYAEYSSDCSWESMKKWADKYGVSKPERQEFKQNEAYTQKSSGCYVATAVYGSYDCPQVWTLRRYRDYTLAETWYGRAFIHVYYTVSPTLVKWFGETEWFKNMWKPKLDKMVKELNEKGIADTPYQDRNW